MEKRRKEKSLFTFIAALLLFTLFICPLKIKAESIAIQFDSVVVGGTKAELRQHEKDDHIIIVDSRNKSMSEGYEISVVTKCDVSARDFLGNKLHVEQTESGVKISADADDVIQTSGATAINIEVSQNKNSENYILIFDGTSNWANIYETYIADTTGDEVNYLDDNTVIRGSSSLDSSLKEISVKSSVKSVSVIRWRQTQKNNSYSAQNIAWLANGENYVRINGTKDSPFSRMDGSTTYQQEFRSPDLNLKKGVNIIEMYSASGQALAKDKEDKDAQIPEGLSFTKTTYDCAVYLVYFDGTSIEKQPESNTALGYVEATQLGSSSVKMDEYPVQEKNGQYTIAVPVQMPLDKIILGLAPADPGAKVEILDNGIIAGSQVGMYCAVKIGADTDSIRVKATAENGKDTAEHVLKIKKASAECSLQGVTAQGLTLKDYSTKVTTEFSTEKYVYILQQNDSNGKLQLTADDKMSVKINGKETREITIDQKDYLAYVVVTAEDGVHTQKYYFVYQDAEGNVPFISAPDENEKAQATEMLKPWFSRSDSKKRDMNSQPYWSVFMSIATNLDVNNGFAADPNESTYNQATDYSRAILQLVLLGYNPYDYEGRNLVAELRSVESVDGLYGGYANNEWALMALKAVGEPIPESLIEYVKTVDMFNNMSTDMRGWAIAELRGLIPDEELVKGIVALKELQEERGDGIWGNAWTNGCVLSGIVGAGVDLGYFDHDGQNLLTCIQNSAPTAVAEENKDLVIGLGDLLNESNVWARCTLDDTKWDSLIAAANTLKTEGKGGGTLSEILSKAEAVTERTGSGSIYYELYDEVSALDKTWRYDITFGPSTERVELQEGVHYNIGKIVDATNDTHGWVAVLQLRPVGRINRIGLVDGPDENLDNKMVSSLLPSAKLIPFSEDGQYLDSVYFTMYIGPKLSSDAAAVTPVNGNIVKYGPVKIDGSAPALNIGLTEEELTTGKEIQLSRKPGQDKIYVKTTDTASGICSIAYTINGTDWTTVYDAAKDDRIDVDNAIGKLEKQVEIPVGDTAEMQIKVIDIAGYETVSKVDIISAPEFAEEPEAAIYKDKAEDLVWSIKLNGAAIAGVKAGDDTLTEKEYSVDEKGKLTITKDFLQDLAEGEQIFTITFTRGGGASEDILTVPVTVTTVEKAVQELKNKVDALGDEITLSMEDTVTEIKDTYEGLPDIVKEEVPQDVTDKIQQAIEKIAALRTQIETVVNAINSIGEVTIDSEASLIKIRDDYNELTEEQKEYVGAEVYQKLVDAENTLLGIKNQAEADKVTALIEGLPNPIISIDSEADVLKAEGAYESLTDDQKVLISAETKQILDTARETLNQLKASAQKAVDTAIGMIDDLPDADSLTLQDETAVADARGFYDSLQPESIKAQVTNYQKLLELEAKLVQLKLDYVIELVNALPEVEDIIGNAEDGSDTELTEQQITDIAAAWSAYSDLSEAQKESMQGTEEYSKLEALHTVASLYEGYIEQVLEPLVRQIQAFELPLTRERLGEAALLIQKYDANTEALTYLESIEGIADKIGQIRQQMTQLNQDITDAAYVDSMIEELPDSIDKDNLAAAENLIGEIRAAYEALSEQAKGFVENMAAVDTVEALAANYKADVKAADRVVSLFNTTQDLAEGSITDDETVRSLKEALEAYNGLTSTAQKMISQDILDAMDDLKEQISEAKTNAAKENSQVTINGTVPWDMGIEIERLTSSDDDFTTLSNDLKSSKKASIVKALSIHVYQIMADGTRQDYILKGGLTLTIHTETDMTGETICLAHLLSDGTIEYLDVTVSGKDAVFTTESTSSFAVGIVDKSKDNNNNNNNNNNNSTNNNNSNNNSSSGNKNTTTGKKASAGTNNATTGGASGVPKTGDTLAGQIEAEWLLIMGAGIVLMLAVRRKRNINH